MIEQISPILVLGGTGHFGRHIVRTLLQSKQPVRVLSRTADQAQQVLGPQVEILAGDITDRTALLKAVAGTRAIVIAVSAFRPRSIRRIGQIERDAILMTLEEAQRAAVPRIVYLSIYDIQEDVAKALDMPVAGIKLQIEAALAHSDFCWTVLGAAPSMQVFFAMIRGDRMMVPGGGRSPLPTVSALDVGQIAAQAALRSDLHGQRIRMVGPEAVSFPEAARRISAVIGRQIRVQKIPLLPLRVGAMVSRPFNPYLRYLLASVRLMNSFPEDMLAQVANDHQRLLQTFDYQPSTLEMEAHRWQQETEVPSGCKG